MSTHSIDLFRAAMRHDGHKPGGAGLGLSVGAGYCQGPRRPAGVRSAPRRRSDDHHNAAARKRRLITIRMTLNRAGSGPVQRSAKAERRIARGDGCATMVLNSRLHLRIPLTNRRQTQRRRISRRCLDKHLLSRNRIMSLEGRLQEYSARSGLPSLPLDGGDK